MARLSGTRPRQLLTVFLSAAAGLPPFYVVTVAWGVARLRLTDFVIAGTIGRTAGQRGQEPGKQNPPNTCSVATIKIAVRLTV